MAESWRHRTRKRRAKGKGVVISFRCDPEELDKILQASAKSPMNLSAWVKNTLLMSSVLELPKGVSQ